METELIFELIKSLNLDTKSVEQIDSTFKCNIKCANQWLLVVTYYFGE